MTANNCLTSHSVRWPFRTLEVAVPTVYVRTRLPPDSTGPGSTVWTGRGSRAAIPVQPGTKRRMTKTSSWQFPKQKAHPRKILPYTLFFPKEFY